MQRITKDVYAETNVRGANIGFVVTGEGVVLIDSPMIPAEARWWREQIAEITDQEIIYLINTDHHRGHILGNQYLTTAVIAHELAWKEMKSYGDSFRQRLINVFKDSEPEVAAEFENLKIILPRVTFTNRMTLHKGDKTIRLIHVGGHTAATSLVHVVEDGVLFTGDVVVNGRHPFIGHGNSKKWLEALTLIRKLRVKTIVPGHGEICDRDTLQRLSEYIRQMRTRVRKLYLDGRSKTETASRVDLLNFFPVPDKDRQKIRKRFKASVGRVYEEMRASYEPSPEVRKKKRK
ncbi:MAG TPA: MBL fold metallo-hydrolase [Anaerolineae bacterium]|nr:MBL fold metallo-hydrolase [Anaerolineae bacterium]